MKLLLTKFVLAHVVVLLVVSFNFAQIEHGKAIELYQKGEYEKAAEFLQTIVETDKNDREAWLYLGMSFAKLKKQDRAVSAFQKADKLVPVKALGNDKDLIITTKPRPSYTDDARMNQVQGTIKAAVEFGADGKMKYAFLFQTLPSGLTKNVVDVMQKIKFEPAIKNGKPITTIGIIKYSFTIY